MPLFYSWSSGQTARAPPHIVLGDRPDLVVTEIEKIAGTA
jgi:hypothetical protein